MENSPRSLLLSTAHIFISIASQSASAKSLSRAAAELTAGFTFSSRGPDLYGTLPQTATVSPVTYSGSRELSPLAQTYSRGTCLKRKCRICQWPWINIFPKRQPPRKRSDILNVIHEVCTAPHISEPLFIRRSRCFHGTSLIPNGNMMYL